LRFRVNAKARCLEVSPQIEDTDWDLVFDAMHHREITRLNATSITDDALLRLARRSDVTVTSLDLSGWHGRLTNKGLAALTEMPRLRELQLCWQLHITDDGLAYLSECGQVETVNVMGTNTGGSPCRKASAA